MPTPDELNANCQFKTYAEKFKKHQLGKPTWRQIGAQLANRFIRLGWYEERLYESLVSRIEVICRTPTDAEKEKNQMNYIFRGGDKEIESTPLIIRLLFVFRQEEELAQRTDKIGDQFIFNVADSLENDESILFQRLGWQQYFDWGAFQALIFGQQMPAVWQNLPSTPGLRSPFSGVDSPVSGGKHLDVENLFADPCLTIAPNIRLAHTLIDLGPRFPSDVETIWDEKDDYEIRIEKARNVLDWMIDRCASEKERLSDLQYNGAAVRLRSCNIVEANVQFECHRTYFFNTIATNEMVQHNARLKGSNEAVIDLLLPKDGNDQRWLGDLNNLLSNHVGITSIILTSDAYPLMFHRPSQQHTNPGTVGFVTSSVWAWEPTLEPHQYLTTRSRQETGLDWSDFAKIPGSVDDDKNSSILYLGATREWKRAGKPEMFYLVLSKLTLDDHIKALRKAVDRDNNLRNKKVRAETIVRSRQLHICQEDELGKAKNVKSGIERILELNQIDGAEFEEPVKAGLWLLHRAYCGPRQLILQRFLERHGIDFVA